MKPFDLIIKIMITALFIVVSACLITVPIVWTYHLLAPDSLHFLSEGKVRGISYAVFGGVITFWILDKIASCF